MTMTLVQTVTVGSGGAASISFSNIPQTGKDLILKISGRSTTTSYPYDSLFITLGTSISNTDHNGRAIQGFGTVITGPDVNSLGGMFIGYLPTANSTSNVFGIGELYIANYATSSAKSGSGECSQVDTDLAWIVASNRTTTGAVTDLLITLQLGGNFAQHSTASLYTIS